MPKRKKKATEMTTDELARRVFPKKVVEQLKHIAHGDDPEKPEHETKGRSSLHD